MRFSLKTSNPLSLALRGVVAGATVVGVMCAVGLYFGLPLDVTKLLAVFTVGAIWVAIACYERDPKQRQHAQPAVEILMKGVQWDFSATAPDDLESFIAKVGDYQSDSERWTPNEPIDDDGPITVEFNQFWKEDGAPETRVVSESPLGGKWTHGTLLHSLHRHLQGKVDLGDSVFFEGLAQLGPQRYRLWLGR